MGTLAALGHPVLNIFALCRRFLRLFLNKCRGPKKVPRFKVHGSKVQGSRFKVQGSRFKVPRFKVQGSRFKVQGSGL
jgi:hypothetical protein